MEGNDIEDQKWATNRLKEVFNANNNNLLATALHHVSVWKRVPIDDEYVNILHDIKVKLTM